MNTAQPQVRDAFNGGQGLTIVPGFRGAASPLRPRAPNSNRPGVASSPRPSLLVSTSDRERHIPLRSNLATGKLGPSTLVRK